MPKVIKAIILLVIGLILGYSLSLTQYTKNISDSTEYINKIDSLESEIYSLSFKRDSINIVIDTIRIEIESNRERYEENINIINNNSISDNYLFFTDYINRYKIRYDSIHNH